MNVILTDLQLLTPEVQEAVAAADSRGGDFTGLFQQQFPTIPANESQAIEFEEFFIQNPALQTTPTVTPEKLLLTATQVTPDSSSVATEPALADLLPAAVTQVSQQAGMDTESGTRE